MTDIARIAGEIAAAQDSAQTIAPITSRDAGFDIDSGYAVARAIHEQRVAQGAHPVGRKIGFTNAKVQQQYGVDQPIWGHVYDKTLVSVEPAATFSVAGMSLPRIEPELVVHFRAAPPVGGSPDAILQCVDWIAHGFEIVCSPYPDWKFQAADAIAASSLHGALLIGAPQAVDRLGSDPIGALMDFSLLLYCDGQLRDSGTGANVLGHPLTAIAHLTRVLAAHGDALQAGELVTTGTVTAALLITAGETWSTELTGIALPGLSVTFS